MDRKNQRAIFGTFIFVLSLLSWPNYLTAQETIIDEKPQVAATTPVEVTTDETENTAVTQALEDLLQAMKLGNFVYQVEERPDPFMPFISDKVAQPDEADSENGERLTGMRQFEPGQLNLVAIMFTESNPMAMVEDSSHKGYLIHRGTKIGKTGVVTDIMPNEVIIKQLSYSMDQVKKYSTMEMILRKEGEK
ncbi:MAG: hypothetical protein HGA96_00600 [Desulfobulbaceae bacterium]|nr:hypothetical protein [Desulfobulbaceae bacterium]